MSKYVDGFLLAVPKKNIAAYLSIAAIGAKVWREHGALDYFECIAGDVKPGKLTSFPQAAKLKPGETVVFSWITYKTRQHRDCVNAKVMKDPRIAKFMNQEAMPFDMKRMIYGGFKVLLSA